MLDRIDVLLSLFSGRLYTRIFPLLSSLLSVFFVRRSEWSEWTIYCNVDCKHKLQIHGQESYYHDIGKSHRKWYCLHISDHYFLPTMLRSSNVQFHHNLVHCPTRVFPICVHFLFKPVKFTNNSYCTRLVEYCWPYKYHALYYVRNGDMEHKQTWYNNHGSP